MTIAVIAGAVIAGVTVLTGHAPTGMTSSTIQMGTLLSTVSIQARAVWRVRDESTIRYLALTTAAATTVTVLTFTSLCIGATATWLLWAFSVVPRAQNAILACSAAAGLALAVARRLVPATR